MVTQADHQVNDTKQATNENVSTQVLCCSATLVFKIIFIYTFTTPSYKTSRFIQHCMINRGRNTVVSLGGPPGQAGATLMTSTDTDPSLPPPPPERPEDTCLPGPGSSQIPPPLPPALQDGSPAPRQLRPLHSNKRRLAV